MHVCTKVTLRQRLLKSGKVTLYLDYYPAIRNPRTNRSQRHEYLGIYLYGMPKNAVERNFNQSMLEKAELIRCRRQETVINRQFGFLDHHQLQENFLSYFEKITRRKYQKWSIVYQHFLVFTELHAEVHSHFSEGTFPSREYLLNAHQLKCTNKKLSQNAAAGYFSTFRALLKMAYKEKLLRENINDYLDYIEWEEVEREFLTQEELIQLAQTPCEIEVLKRASLFSCLTGLRFSDVYNLTWEHVREVSGIGLCLVFRTQKTKTPTTLPLCQEAIELMGETTTGKVFEGFKKTMTSQPLRDWIEAAGIHKHITFHCFRHTYATLQMAMSTNPYVVSQALTHKNLETTLRYTHDIPTALMDTLGKISIKPKDLSVPKSPAD